MGVGRQLAPCALGSLLLLLLMATVLAGSFSEAGAARVRVVVAGQGARVAVDLPPGLSTSERAALRGAGAYGCRPITLLIVGDSIAMTLGMGLSEGSQAGYGVTVSDHATLGCDLDAQLQILDEGVAGRDVQGCEYWRGMWPFLAAAMRPQVVALGIGRWEVTDHWFDGRWVHIGERAWDHHVAADLRSVVSIFSGFGAKVVLLTMPYLDPTTRPNDGLTWSEDMPARTRAYNALVREVARADPSRVGVMDLNRMLSPAGVYTASLDGIDVRSADGIHISPAGGELLQRDILPEVVRLGLADEAERTTAGTRTSR
ncbi:MAG TPA: SGNH hydrolase domain-containing protein [Acidimicrobiales bacterium]|nr:SGNH hydrolase domain-containing protein [Acidimicrobiales bacterium]